MKTIATALAATALISIAAPAHAGQVEYPDHEMNGWALQVYYAEETPTERFPHRTYFETNDGAAYTYVTNGSCERDDKVPDRICHTVFWYAR